MSYGWPAGVPRPQPSPLLRTVRELFSSERVLTSEGAGGNLVDLLAELVRAIDGCTVEIKRFNDLMDRGQ